MSHLTLSLLGTFQATLDYTAVTTFESNKVRALLAFLAVESERPHARETLAGLLWPDFPNRDALRNLRLALSNLRQAIGDHHADPPFLFITRETIQFNPHSDHTLDAAAFIRTSTTQPKTCRLGTPLPARFLDGFSCDSAPFEEWVLQTREQIGQQILRVLRDLTAQCAARGEYEQAQIYARQQLELEPCDELAHQQLMRALTLGGQRSAALAQYESCRRWLKQELGVEPSGETVALYESIRDGKLAKAKTAARSNLPVPVTSFIGREDEIAEIKRLLTTTRLLTLTGAGGCGKTRLAIQVAADLNKDDLSSRLYPDGVWFIDFAPVSDPALVPQVIASMLGLHAFSDQPIQVLLQDFLRVKNLLFILDNCEHLIEACAQLCDSLLRACPDLQVLATSREALNIAGETALRVPSLALPDLQKSPTMETLKPAESVRLFVERARAARSNFQLSDANARAVAQICQRLDGIPLAIELAAARVSAISVGEIAARLDDRFRLLTSGSRTALPRYRTLRASIDWSYNLLSDAERALLRHLAVFVGGFGLEAVEAVAAEPGADENTPDLLDLLAQLVGKSLVLSEQSGPSRYRLLETIREYSLAKLSETGEMDAYRTRHLDYYLKLAEEAEPRLVGEDQLVWLDRLQMEDDNLRAAIQWAEENDNGEAALRLAVAIQSFWIVRGHVTEARRRLDVILALPSANQPGLAFWRARALLNASIIAGYEQADYAAANPLGRASLALFQALGNDKWVAAALSNLGELAWQQGEYASSHSFQTEYLAIQRELGDEPGIAQGLTLLGIATREMGDYAAGRRLIEQGHAIFRRLGRKWKTAMSLMHLGSTAIAQRDPAARAILEESLAIFRELGDKWSTGRALHDLGQAAAWQGDDELARAWFIESVALLREIGDRRNAIKCVEGLAGIAAAHGQTEHAARLFGASEAVREKLGTPLPASYRANYERTIAALAAQLDKEQMGKWWAEGRTMTLEQAIDCALGR